MATLTPQEQQALLWPIKAKGGVQRLNPLGDPSIEIFYHKAMEQGRVIETSISDANHWLLQKKQLLTTYIQSYTHMNQLAVDGQLGHNPRVPKYIADGISILQTAQRLQQEIVSLVAAVQQNITMLLAIEQSMLAMVQTALNSIANLLNNICNWGIPALPSIPNLFPDQIWNWNGFLFSPLALFAVLKSSVNFNFNFSFKNCNFGPTSPSNLFVDNPLSTQTYSGLVYGTANYTPPFNGQATPAAQDLNDPAFISEMQGLSAYPQYNPAFNPNENMLGAVPDPHQIIDNWQMPATVYTNNIVSICPQLLPNTVFLTDPDYANPNYAVRQPALRKALVHFITLDNIIATNYDPFIVSAWLICLNLARQGRGGVWLPNFEAVYQQYLSPSINGLQVNAVPWNDVLPGSNAEWQGSWDSTAQYEQNDVVVYNGINYQALISNSNSEPDISPADWGAPSANVVYNNAPVIPLITLLQSMSANQLNHLLWQLSYIEAAILGYTRSRNWDAYQDVSYLSSPTASDLDYQPTLLISSNSSLTLGEGVAQFPVPITFPAVMKTSLDAVITIATANITADLTYLSPRLGNRYTYNQFAVATQVDRYSQFWRDFSTNLTSFLAQDPYLVQSAITYPEILDGAIDPLASALNLAAYQNLQSDVSTRNRTWVPGTPLPEIPIQPMTAYSSDVINDTGWGNPPNPEMFDAITFLSRPDIQSQPIPVQIAMLRTNLSYASINTWSTNMQNEVATQLANANALLESVTTPGFNVSDYATTTTVGVVEFGAITNVSIASNVLTITMNAMPAAFASGASVVFYGLSAATFLNGQTITVNAGATTTSFTASFTNPNYSAPDTGGAFISTFSGSLTNVAFDPLMPPQNYDYTGNYTNPTTFTIQTADQYLGFAVINWNLTTADTVGIMVLQNGTPIGVNIQSGGSGALSTSVSLSGAFAQGDTLHVAAFTMNVSENVVPNANSNFSLFAVLTS